MDITGASLVALISENGILHTEYSVDIGGFRYTQCTGYELPESIPV